MTPALASRDRIRRGRSKNSGKWGRGGIVVHEKDFDGSAFLNLLSEVMADDRTGVVSIRIHIRDGMPWALCVQFDNVAAKAA